MKTIIIALVLLMPAMAQEQKPEEPKFPGPPPTFEINPQPEVPLPPLPVNPEFCMEGRVCTHRLLLKA